MPISPNIGANYAEGVAEVYREAELRILGAIAAGIADGLDTPEWQIRQLARLQQVRNEVIRILSVLDPLAASAILSDLNDAYAAGQASTFADIGLTLTGFAATIQQQSAVASLVADVQDGIASAQPGILRSVDDVYRRVVADATAETLTGGSQRAAVQKALNRLLGRGLSAVPTARGKIALGDYVTMAVRTAVARSAMAGATDTMGLAGLDFVIIHPGPRACDICDRWARSILAREASGATGTVTVKSATDGHSFRLHVDATLADARAAGWGHPNCRCSLAAYIPGVTTKDAIKRPPWDEDGYHAQQQQRGLERQVRAWKSRSAISLDPHSRRAANAQVQAYQARLRQHLADHPALKRQSSREQISGSLSGVPGAATALRA